MRPRSLGKAEGQALASHGYSWVKAYTRPENGKRVRGHWRKTR
jgi:hypothetical protein